MALRIFNDQSSTSAQRNMANNRAALQAALIKLTSGMGISMGADHAAGMAMSKNMRIQAFSLGMPTFNANDGISFIATAGGGLN